MNIKKISNLIIAVSVLVLFFASFSFAGKTNKAVDSKERGESYAQFIDSHPSLQEQKIGNPAADTLFTGIQGLAVQQHQAFQLFASNTDGPVKPLAVRLDAIYSGDGEQAYLDAVQALDPADKVLYEGYLTTQRQLTGERIKMLPEAILIVGGLKNLNPRELAKNPMALVSTGRALTTAVDQGDYVMTSLNYMKEMNELMELATNYRGR